MLVWLFVCFMSCPDGLIEEQGVNSNNSKYIELLMSYVQDWIQTNLVLIEIKVSSFNQDLGLI